MVLSLLSHMPPESTPPTIEESLAKLANNIYKLELVVKRLAASTANLVLVTSQTTFTTNEPNTRLETTLHKIICPPTITNKESNNSTSNNNTDITETTFTHVDTETNSTQLLVQNKQISSLVTRMPKPETNDTDHTPPLPPLLSDNLQIHLEKTSLPTFTLVKLTENKENYKLWPLKSSPVITSLAPPFTTCMILEDKDRFQAWSIDTCMRS